MKGKVSDFFYYFLGFRKINKPSRWTIVIIAHILAWLLFFSLPLLFFQIDVFNKGFFYRELTNKLMLIGLFYFHYFFLIPKVLQQRKYLHYTYLLLLSLIILLSISWYADRRFNTLYPPPQARATFIAERDSVFALLANRDKFMFPVKDKKMMSHSERFFLMAIPTIVSSAFLLLLLGGFIHLGFLFLKNLHEKRSLENAGLKAELSQLKSQINPHFLFNSLNTIYSQAYLKSENTEKSILKLSDILRYVIYDTSSEKVSLEKELQYISNYIDLQKFRLSSKVILIYKVEGDAAGLYIAPLLLVTFIENAFKHGVSYNTPSVISITISVFDKTLTMEVSNPLVNEDSFAKEGIGLKNSKRRLELLYAEKHSLNITINDNYVVNLKLDLHHDQLHYN